MEISSNIQPPSMFCIRIPIDPIIPTIVKAVPLPCQPTILARKVTVNMQKGVLKRISPPMPRFQIFPGYGGITTRSKLTQIKSKIMIRILTKLNLSQKYPNKIEAGKEKRLATRLIFESRSLELIFPYSTEYSQKTKEVDVIMPILATKVIKVTSQGKAEALYKSLIAFKTYLRSGF